MKKMFLASVLTGLCLLGSANTASSATFTVTTGANEGTGSLRQALSSANANGEADVINVDSAVKEIYLASEIAITGDVTINGLGGTVRGSRVSRLFAISGGTVKFDRFTFTDGYPLSENGGAMYIDSSAATVEFVNCTFFNNRSGGSGAAVYVYGAGSRSPTSFVNCTITNNEAANNGGGVAVAGGTVQFTASVVTGNRAVGNADVYADNGTVSNTGYYNVIGQTNVPDVFRASSGNDISVASSDVFKTPGVLSTVDNVLLAELLSATANPAIDKIPTSNWLSLPTVDQRGAKRPQMTAIDAGAYELSPIALTGIEMQGSPYIEVLTSEEFSVTAQPDGATLDVRTYTNGLYWNVINPTNLEVLSVDQNGRVSAFAVGTATVKVTAYGWDGAGNIVTREASKVVKVGEVPLAKPTVAVSIVNEKKKMQVNEQHTLRINVVVAPEETPYTVTFESVNPTIATVTQASSTSTSAVVKAAYPGETMINVIVKATNSKGTGEGSEGYLLTVTERSTGGGGGGGGCDTGLGLAAFALLGALYCVRSRG